MKNFVKVSALSVALTLAAVSCKKNPTDAELTTQATQVVNTYPGTSVEVKEGVAHISGTFATQADRDAALASVRSVKGVKEVMDMSTVAPATSATAAPTASPVDASVQKRVKDALKDYPNVQVGVVNNELTLTGNATQEQARKIKQSVDALNVGKVNYNYTVK